MLQQKSVTHPFFELFKTLTFISIVFTKIIGDSVVEQLNGVIKFRRVIQMSNVRCADIIATNDAEQAL